MISRQHTNSGLNPGVVFGLVAASAAVMVTNQLLTLVDGALLSLIWWGAFNSPIKTVIASILSYQWLQASAKLWLGNLMGVSLAEANSTPITDEISFEVTEYTATACMLAFAAIAALSIGLHILKPEPQSKGSDFANFAPERLALLYLPLLFFSQLGVFAAGGLGQLIGTVGYMRFLPIVLLVGVWFYSKRGGLALAAVCCTEVALGFVGFFSEWKGVLILVGITLISLARYTWGRWLPLLVGGLVTLLLMGAIWTAIKPDYRAALNGGTGQQTVILSQGEQIGALSQAVSDVDLEDLQNGFLGLLLRLSYVDFLADAIETVPASVEYQNGALWGEAVDNILQPRFIFPNKRVLPSDSERTMRFTGRTMASDRNGTSISIGYVGDSYIDFGVFGAVLIPFLLGLACSLGTRVLTALSRTRDPAIGLPLAICFLWPLQLFETSNIKLLGGLGWGLIVCVLFALAWPSIKPFLYPRGSRAPPKVFPFSTR